MTIALAHVIILYVVNDKFTAYLYKIRIVWELILLSIFDQHKPRVLIVDDCEMNRNILSEMLGEEYEIIEAENGAEAVAILQKDSVNISLVLLDIVMPVMDGYGVLSVMNEKHWIDDVPVIMISSDNSIASMRRAYSLGITEFISRPFDSAIVRHRVVNTIMLYAKQKKLVTMVADKIYEKEMNSSLMIDILSHIVEFRNGESGMHVLHVRLYTQILLRQLVKLTDKYNLTESDISLICKASALHDIGKISIPDEIINKPGRLDKDEFEIMKGHSMAGASMLEELHFYKNEPLVQIAYQICRWHHERYDGRGYPDGLKGDEIPIAAQIVAIADVYDALTSERVYKAAFSHEKALCMILNGECGTFNPLLLECLEQAADSMQKCHDDKESVQKISTDRESVNVELLQYDELSSSEETLHLLEYERMKNNFFASISSDVNFEYISVPPMINLSPNSDKLLGLNTLINDPDSNEKLFTVLSKSDYETLKDRISVTTPVDPTTEFECNINFVDGAHKVKIICRSVWSTDGKMTCDGVIGKIVDCGHC